MGSYGFERKGSARANRVLKIEGFHLFAACGSVRSIRVLAPSTVFKTELSKPLFFRIAASGEWIAGISWVA